MTKNHETRARDEAERAKRDLKRLDAQAEVIGTSNMARIANKQSNQLTTKHIHDEDDVIEVWGKRIGRGLGVLFAIYLVYWLLIFLTRG